MSRPSHASETFQAVLQAASWSFVVRFEHMGMLCFGATSLLHRTKQSSDGRKAFHWKWILQQAAIGKYIKVTKLAELTDKMLMHEARS